MKLAALVTLGLAAVMVIAGLFPCLGALNWFAGAVCIIPILLGIIGFAQAKKATGTDPYLAAHIIGIDRGGIAVVRCLIGGGVV